MSLTPKSQDPATRPSGVLVLADGHVFYGIGAGHEGETLGEVCFNTAMTGYQEILTDPSYSQQIICFTFPHIGNTGVNRDDNEDQSASHGGPPSGARGVIMRSLPTKAANWRAEGDLDDWLKTRQIVALAGIDTRALTAHIRQYGMAHGVIAHAKNGAFDITNLRARAQKWGGLSGADLAREVSTEAPLHAQDAGWNIKDGYAPAPQKGPHVVVIDYGAKGNILRLLAANNLRTTLVPASHSAQEILALKPDGVLLSNGPGDPAATARTASPVINALIDANLPVFGICLGHQLLALALGAKTIKMDQGHHGANHPVKDLTTGKVEIVSMNHGFCVDSASLPGTLEATHISLFDGTNCGLRLKGKPVFSVQYHPEASPGPQDSFYLFADFAAHLGNAA